MRVRKTRTTIGTSQDRPRTACPRSGVGAAIESELPELADARSQRLVEELELPLYDAEVLTAERALADYYEQAVALASSTGGWLGKRPRR